MRGKKLTIEFIKSEFENENWILKSTEYVNAHQKLGCICPNGHECSIRWNNWQQGQRCSMCAGLAKPIIDFVRSEFENEGWQLLSKEYVNNYTKLNCICSKGHKCSISWANWQKGRRCPVCAGQAKPTIEFIRSDFEEKSYIFLTKEYINNRQELDYICPNGHKCNISWRSWQQGARCLICAGNAKKTIEFIKVSFDENNYILLTTEYVNCEQKLYYICPNGHRHSISWANWQQGQRCPYCTITASKGEMQVRSFIKSLGIKVLANDRNQIFNPETDNGLELDIFMPTISKAIEYNGEYWHKDKNVEARDLLKQQLCKSKNIDLLTIWENEWKNNGKKCENKIMKFVFSSERGI
jgi:hypothetical protein